VLVQLPDQTLDLYSGSGRDFFSHE
jgi:hypothetical protein